MEEGKKKEQTLNSSYLREGGGKKRRADSLFIRQLNAKMTRMISTATSEKRRKKRRGGGGCIFALYSFKGGEGEGP